MTKTSLLIFFFFLFHQTLTSGPLTCEETLDRFEWLLSTESIKIEVWKSAICQNGSLEEALLMEWWPLVQKVKAAFICLCLFSFGSILALWLIFQGSMSGKGINKGFSCKVICCLIFSHHSFCEKDISKENT